MTARIIQQGELEGGRKIELVGKAEGDPEFFIEGIHGMQINGATVKLNLYTSAIDSTPEAQRRESVCRLVMTTPQFVQMVAFLAQTTNQLREAAQLQLAAQQAADGAAPSNPAPSA
jgi:hypothetical protein